MSCVGECRCLGGLRLWSLRSWSTGGCELPDVGLGTKLRSSVRAESACNHRTYCDQSCGNRGLIVIWSERYCSVRGRKGSLVLNCQIQGYLGSALLSPRVLISW